MAIFTQVFCSVKIFGPIVMIVLVLEIIASKFKQAVKTPPLNVFIWILFTASLSLLGWILVSVYEPSVFIMLSCIIIAQVLAQLVSVNQVKIEMKFKQSIFSVTLSALLVYQLFILYSNIPFHQMIIAVFAGIVFGFILTLYIHIEYLAQVERSDFLSSSVSIYYDLISIALTIPKLLQEIIIRERKNKI